MGRWICLASCWRAGAGRGAAAGRECRRWENYGAAELKRGVAQEGDVEGGIDGDSGAAW